MSERPISAMRKLGYPLNRRLRMDEGTEIRDAGRDASWRRDLPVRY